MRSKIIIYILFCPLFAFAEFTSNDSYNVNEIKNIATDIELDTSALRDDSAYIREYLNNIRAWKPLIEDLEESSATIKGHTTYFYNVLSSLAQTYPTIAETSWFGQLLKNTKDLKDKLDSLASDVSDIKYNVENIDTNVGLIKDDVGTIKGNVASIDTNVGTIKDNVASIDTNVYTIKDNTTVIKDDVSTISDYQSQILRAIQVGDTNLYNAFFNPSSTLRYSTWYDSVYDFNSMDSNHAEPPLKMSTISTPSKNQSFIESLFKYLPDNINQLVQLSQLQNVANLNLQNIRKFGIHTITNQLAEIIQKTNSVAKVEVDEIDMSYTPINQYGSDIDINDSFSSMRLKTTGDFYQDVIKFSKVQVELQSGNNFGLLSIITNLQVIVSELTKPSDTNELESSAEETEQEISKDLQENEDQDGTKYIGFKNEYQNIQNSLSFGSLGDDVKSYSQTLQIMDRYYFEMGELSIEIPAIEVSLELLEKITTFVRFVMTICWIGILLSLIFMFYRFFVFFASKFIEFTSKMTGQ